MKILIVSQNHISRYTGGNEIYSHTLADTLVRKGHQVTYLTNVGKSMDTAYKLRIRPGLRVNKFILPTRNWFQAISEIKPDIVHATGSGLGITLTGIYCRFKGMKSVLTFQAPLSAGLLGKLDEWIQAHSFHKIIVTSETNKKYLQQKTRTPIEVVMLCLKSGFKKGKSKQKQKYVFMVAKLDEHHYYKGIDVALRALTKLPEPYQLWIAGDGSKLSDYRCLADQLGIGSRVKFLNQIPDDKLMAYYQTAEVFILPSTNHSEGFGLVLLEAMACGTPAITTNCVGIAPLLKKKGLAKIISPNSAEELSRAIRNPGINNQQLEAAREFALSRTPELMTAETERVYEQLCLVSK